jgi:tetratricopeptide (TPR) repeat protein
MKRQLFDLLVLIVAIASVGCGGFASDNLPTPDAQGVRLSAVELFCSTHSDRAAQFYDDALSSERKGKPEDAERLYRQAIELDPAFCDAMDNLGRLLRSQGKLDEAISWYRRSLEILPGNTVARMNLGLAYNLQGKFAEAVAEYETLVRTAPDDPEGSFGLGVCYLDMQRPAEAIPQFEKAEDLYARQSSALVVDARYFLGVSHYGLGECDKARGYFEEVLPSMPDSASTNYYLGLCHLCPGAEDIELARRFLKRAQSLGYDVPAEAMDRVK